MSELMSLEDLAVVERWNKADMREGRHYATTPSITQISKMIESIHAAHKLKQRVEELEAVVDQRNAMCSRYIQQIEVLKMENEHHRMRPAK